MFTPIKHDTNRVGSVTSIIANCAGALLVIVFSSSTPHKTAERYNTTLIFPKWTCPAPDLSALGVSNAAGKQTGPRYGSAHAMLDQVTQQPAPPEPTMADAVGSPNPPQPAPEKIVEAPQPKLAGFGNNVSAAPMGAVAVSGFGSPVGPMQQKGKVVIAGFGRSDSDTGTLPVVTFEPDVQYTSAAMSARVQGTITLQVRFTASGTVEVLKVVNGLGFGLDEQVAKVAEGIRFVPATDNGKPVDRTTLMHVTFTLQS